MNISGMPSAIASITASSSLSSSPAVAAPGEDDGTARPHRGHGGGHMHQAVMQALQSLGLSPANDTSDAGSAASSASSTSSSSTGDDSDTSDSASPASSIGQDMRQFMHALFEAVRSEGSASSSSSTSASTTSGASDPTSSFASGLAALVSQVTGGDAPADLQSAFTKLATDLQATTASSSSSSTDSAGSSSTDLQASLQAFLTQLQNNLGYGSSSSAALGALVTTQA